MTQNERLRQIRKLIKEWVAWEREFVADIGRDDGKGRRRQS
jgi:hypothetical protein